MSSSRAFDRPASFDSKIVEDQRDAYTWSDDAAYTEAAGIGGNAHLTADQLTFLARLWRAIDYELPNEAFLSEYAHIGRVYLRARIGQDGQFDPASLRARAIDPVLKVLAARATRAGFAGDDLRPPTGELLVNLRFTWASSEVCAVGRGIRNEFLSFCRHATNERRTFSIKERLDTYTKAIFENGPWAYEEIREYLRQEARRETEFDPFQALRRDPDWRL